MMSSFFWTHPVLKYFEWFLSRRENEMKSEITWVELLEAPLLFVSFSFPKEISWRIQCAPVFGESGCMYTRFPFKRNNTYVTIKRK